MHPPFWYLKALTGPSTCAPKTPDRFEICKQVCLLRGASILTRHHGQCTWSLAEMEHCSVQHHITAVKLFIKTA